MRNYIHTQRSLSKEESDSLCEMLATFPWTPDNQRKQACYFGKSYTLSGGPRSDEIPVIPPDLLPLVKRVAESAFAPVNYIQLHRYAPDADVRPHRDPAGMIVPMLTVGQVRTFRVGGEMPWWCYVIRQKQRKIDKHVPSKEIVMNHGDLLTFNGGRILHSMFAATLDPNFNPNGYDVRYSLLFRWTTDEMRERGTVQKNLAGTRHTEAYREALMLYRGGLTDYLGRPIA